jgi:hypothetical protein
MKYIYSIFVYALSIVITLYIFPMSISYSRVSDTIEIKTLLTKSDHMVTSLNFQKTNITFGEENKICPNIKCSYEFEKTSLDDGFGAKNSKFLSGTLKIGDKANSEGNSPAYKFYKISGLFNLVNRKENITTGEKILVYEGNLLFDTGNEMFSPSKLEYKSQIKIYDSQKKLELIGTSIL